MSELLTNHFHNKIKEKAMKEIKSNPVLFEKWKTLGLRISMLSSIVQNDMEVSKQDIEEFERVYSEVELDMERLHQMTLEYVS